jgi:hypothetical protein
MPMDYTSERNPARGMSPSLSSQTPGMDIDRTVREFAMRQWTRLRENRAFAVGLLGGIGFIALGSWLAVAFGRRRRSRYAIVRDSIYDKGLDLRDWFRSKLA